MTEYRQAGVRRKQTFVLSDSMRALASLSLVIAFSVFGCTPRTEYPDPTLSEKLGIELELPMPEDEFLELMNARSFAIERHGAGSRFRGVPNPRGIDLEAIEVEHVFLVDTGLNAPAGRVEKYVAYIDANGNVIRVDGNFARVAP